MCICLATGSLLATWWHLKKINHLLPTPSLRKECVILKLLHNIKTTCLGEGDYENHIVRMVDASNIWTYLPVAQVLNSCNHSHKLAKHTVQGYSVILQCTVRVKYFPIKSQMIQKHIKKLHNTKQSKANMQTTTTNQAE